MHSRRRTLWVTVFAVHSDDNVLLELYCRDVIISVSMVMFSAPPAPLWTHLLIMFSGSKLPSLHGLCYHTASVLLMFEVRVNSLSTRTNKRICHQLRTSRKCDVRIIIVYVWTSFWNLIATHYTSSHQETLLHKFIYYQIALISRPFHAKVTSAKNHFWLCFFFHWRLRTHLQAPLYLWTLLCL